MPWRNFKAGEQQIIIGKGVADALKVKQGDWVSIMIPNSNPEHKLMQPKRVRLHIAGILQLSGQLDHSFCHDPAVPMLSNILIWVPACQVLPLK